MFSRDLRKLYLVTEDVELLFAVAVLIAQQDKFDSPYKGIYSVTSLESGNNLPFWNKMTQLLQ